MRTMLSCICTVGGNYSGEWRVQIWILLNRHYFPKYNYCNIQHKNHDKGTEVQFINAVEITTNYTMMQQLGITSSVPPFGSVCHTGLLIPSCLNTAMCRLLGSLRFVLFSLAWFPTGKVHARHNMQKLVEYKVCKKKKKKKGMLLHWPCEQAHSARQQKPPLALSFSRKTLLTHYM